MNRIKDFKLIFSIFGIFRKSEGKKMIKLIALTILFICFSGALSAQNNLDSLWLIWGDKTQADTTRLRAIFKIANDGYLYSNPDSAFILAQKQYEFAKKKGEEKYMADALTIQGVSLCVRGNLDNAIEYWERSLTIYQEIGHKDGVAAVLGNIGVAYWEQGDNLKAIMYYKKSLKIEKELGNKGGNATTLINIGSIYFDQGDDLQALKYYQKGVNIASEVGDQKSIAIGLSNVGLIYLERGDNVQALKSFKRALRIHEEMEDNHGIAFSLNGIGDVYRNKEEYDKALGLYEKAKAKAIAGDFRAQLSLALNGIGEVYKAKGEYQKALGYSQNALKEAQGVEVLSLIRDAANTLWQINEALGKSKEALSTYKLFIASKDSINNEKLKKELVQIEFDAQRKLNEEKARQKLLEEKNKRLEEQKVKQIWIFAFSIFSVVFLFIYLAKTLKSRNKLKLLLKEIQLLKENLAEKSFVSDTVNSEKKLRLDKDRIQKKIEAKLNETDWNILCNLVENPSINNKELASQICLSYEGVRSSLKKLYSLFDLRKDSGKNIRMELVIQALRCSQNN